ncbi:MAG: dihydrolipoyl dehydrogenase [Gammaproteobacteria bacterium]|nr:dihydrolipoyl dehydrogenase [Gammaproteobacteria bacterium]
MERKVDVAIIGAGSAGLTATATVRRYTENFVLIDGGELGTTCARVGCMPSKAAIQVAEDLHRRGAFEREGIAGGAGLSVDIPAALEHVRDLRDVFVDQVLASSIDHMDEEQFIAENAFFLEPTLLQVGDRQIRAEKIILATGSKPVVPRAWEAFGERILTTDTFFEQEDLPARVAVVGLGVIGLELGQTLARLGVQVTGVDLATGIGGLRDPEVNAAAIEIMNKEFPLWLGKAAELSEESDGSLRVSAGEQSVVVDKVLVCMGRRPSLCNLGLDGIGVRFTARGVPEYDPNTMQIGQFPIFIAGDVNGDRPILHEANLEGRMAAYNATHEPIVAFKRKAPLAITFCDPNIVSVGAPLDTLQENAIAIGDMKFGPLGRALVMNKNKGLLRVYARKADGRVLGAAMIAPKGENLGHLLCWCIQQELTVADLLKMPFYHPTIEEGLQGALYDLRRKLDIKGEIPLELELL